MTSIGAALREARTLAGVARGQHEERAGHVLVSGMLSEQLAKQLGQGTEQRAEPGAVVVGDRARLVGASVLVHVVAGDLSALDEELVRAADRLTVPIVLVQIWPQADWSPPFVRTPFVVECQPGSGFPIAEIAARIVEAVESPIALALRVPTLEDAARASTVLSAAVRAGLLGLGLAPAGVARPLVTLEQARMVTTLGRLHGRPAQPTERAELAQLAGSVAAVAGTGFVFREVARSARRVLPRPFADAVVAAGATWLLGTAARRFGGALKS